MKETLQTIGDKLVKLDEKIDAFAKKFDEKLDAGFTAVAVHFGKIDERFVRIDERFTKIDEHLTRIDGRLLHFDARFKQSDDRFGRIERRFDDLETRMLSGFEEVKGGLKLVAARVDDFLKKDVANSRTHATFDQALEDHDNRLVALETGHARRLTETPGPTPRSGPALTNSDPDVE